MSTFKKHVGRIRNTDRRCVVVYMQIPGNEDNALIIDTDALPDRFHDPLMEIIDSVEGQQTQHLHTLLARRVMPNTGVDMMNALHGYGLLRAVEIDNVVMYPAPNAPCPLRTIVDYMNGEQERKPETVELENRVLENQKAQTTQAQLDIAANILQQAQDLEDAAKAKREQAYRLVPHLRPQVTPSPAVEQPLEAPASVTEVPSAEVAPLVTQLEETVAQAQAILAEPVAIDPDLPADVAAALAAAQADFQPEAFEVVETSEILEGNQVDTSDAALQEFLDRAALREDKADKEKWEAMQPKNPVGRPRKDGAPAGTKAEAAPAPKKRGRPPKAKK